MMTSTSESHSMVNGQISWEAMIQAEVKKFNRDEEEKQLEKRSIYHLPAFAKMIKSATVLTPQVASFGPYHHGEQHLMLVEGYKKTALIHFLIKSQQPLQYFIDVMKTYVKDLQACYEFLDAKWQDEDKFIELMITDGCFMLEVLRIHQNQSKRTSYAKHDPIFSDHGAQHKLPYIKRDMLMLENQLPLLVLKVLHQAETNNEINNLVFEFFEMEDMLHTNPDMGLHVLDLYRKGLIETHIQSNSNAAVASTNYSCSSAQENDKQPQQCELLINTEASNGPMLTAVKLHESLIQFKPSGSKKMTSISFDKGTLKLPCLIIDDATESALLNVMAFEHLHVGLEDVVSSYVCFMGELIESVADLQLLRSKKIIHMAVESDQAATNLLNSLSKEVTHDPKGHMETVRNKVKEYCRKKWRRWLANLLDLYFDTPWKTLSVIAAMVLLVLTFVQTFYSVFSYQHPSKKN
ncbi:hypothetical protein IHE45_10G016200 [Dioscorea alata]|uniref:Uncharacterized protein n=1 Tax=Dioscorea alata TaxID=55571 RepID=A0ACB7V959_DIOAL|nr:hypothetical protein IHE45_10G016200 [Dioscorea alata]